MVRLGPNGDVYSLRNLSPGVVDFSNNWNNESLVLLGNLLSSTISGVNVYLMNTITGLRLPTVVREDGTHALAVDTEISIDNATLKINNLFVASSDGLVAGAAYMRMTDAAISDNYTPPAINILQTQSFLMGYDPVGNNWDRLNLGPGGGLVVALPITTTTTNSGVVVGVASTPVLAANPARITATFVNDSNALIYLSKGAPAVIGQGIRLNRWGGSYTIKGDNLTREVINAIATTAASNLVVTEGV